MISALKTTKVTPYTIPESAPVFDLDYTDNLQKLRNT